MGLKIGTGGQYKKTVNAAQRWSQSTGAGGGDKKSLTGVEGSFFSENALVTKKHKSTQKRIKIQI